MAKIEKSNQLFAVEKHGVTDYVLEQYQKNLSFKKISELLKTEKNVQITPHGISRWIENINKDRAADIQAKTTEKFELMVINYQEEIKTILTEVKEMKDLAKSDSDLKAYDRMVGRLFQGIELLAKLMGDIKGPQTFDIKVVINEINQDSFKRNKDLRNALYSPTIIDVESEIIEDDEVESARIRRQSGENVYGQ